MSLYKSMIMSVFALFLLPLVASAEGETRQVTVTGRAEVRVVPDEVVLSIAVETMNLELNLAKEENDRVVNAAYKAIKEMGLSADQAKTDYMRIEPLYTNQRSSSPTLIGYQVSNSLVLTLGEVAQVEDLLSSHLEAGVNRVIGVELRSTEFRQYRDKAMLMALDAARERGIVTFQTSTVIHH